MSDVTVSVTENPVTVDTTTNPITVEVTTSVVEVTLGSTGPQGAVGATGPAGATGAQGSSGVVSVVSPITNSGTSSAAVLGFDQTANNTTNDGRYARLAAAQTFTGTQTITGALVASSGSYIGTGAFIGGVRSTVFTSSAATIGMIVRGAASQSANLQEWQNSAGTVIARIAASGYAYISGITTLNGQLLIQEENSGGNVRFSMATAQVTSPGANKATIYCRAGTTAGTLKLVVRAGAAGAETTILDNIPQ